MAYRTLRNCESRALHVQPYMQRCPNKFNFDVTQGGVPLVDALVGEPGKGPCLLQTYLQAFWYQNKISVLNTFNIT